VGESPFDLFCSPKRNICFTSSKQEEEKETIKIDNSYDFMAKEVFMEKLEQANDFAF